MSIQSSRAVEALRQALQGLPATGVTGFEGFVGHLLSSITGIAFRLASSGLQGGSDGDAALPTDHLSYECKRCDDRIDRDGVLAKLADLSTRQDVDLWILAGTAPIPAQLDRRINEIGQAQALETLVLDWAHATGLPLLGVACAMAPAAVLEFMEGCGLDKENRQAIVEGMTELGRDPRFITQAESIRSRLNTAQLGLESIRVRNIAWMRAKLADRPAARDAFGQPLAPNAGDQHHTLSRPKITDRIRDYLRGEGKDSPLFVTGNDGVGKSWAVAQAWLSEPSPPALFFLAADAFVNTDPEDAIEVVAKAIGRQCGASKRESGAGRWERKLERWLHTSHDGVRFVVYLDGINQQQTVDWARLIEGIDRQIRPAGGRVIVSSRSAYFDSNVSGRLMSFVPQTLPVTEWSREERDALLRHRGLNPRAIATNVLDSLRNPRLLGIAFTLLDNEAIASLEQLDIGRLLFEHLLAANQFGSRPVPAHEMVRRLSDHARRLIERVHKKELDDLLIFESLNAVIEEHYFHPLKQDPRRYSLSQDGIRLALALAVLDHLQSAVRNDKPLLPAALALIDPVAALDDASSVILAALSIGCADDNYGDDIRVALLIAFSELQNPEHDELLPFISLATKRPSAFMETAFDLCLKRNDPPNLGWVKLAIWDAAQSTSTREAINHHVGLWLRTHSLDPTRAIPNRHGIDQAQQDATLQKAKDKLDTAINGLSRIERKIFHSIVSVPSDPMTLHEFAFALLVGTPLAPLADSLVAFSLGSHLDPTPFPADERLSWVCRLNTVDWVEMRNSILVRLDDLLEAGTSSTANWVGAKLLLMTGDPEDAVRAHAIRRTIWPSPRYHDASDRGWRRLDPSNIDNPEPRDLDECAQRFLEIPARSLNLQFGVTSEDHNFDEALPTLARFRPDAAVSRILDLAIDAPTRKGMPFRQGLLAIHKHAAALNAEVAQKLLALRQADLVERCEGLPEGSPALLSSICLDISFAHITPEQQLEALLVQGADRRMWQRLVPKFKTSSLDPVAIEKSLAAAIQAQEETVICYLLGFLCAIPMREGLEQTILDLTASPNERIRVYAFALIYERGDRSQLATVAAGSWHARDKCSGEAYYGSLVLLRAISDANAEPADVAGRISADLFGELAPISDAGARLCADVLEANLRHASNTSIRTPAVAITAEDRINDPSLHLNITSKPSLPSGGGVIEALDVDSLESSESSRRNNNEVFRTFSSTLESANVSFVLHPLTVTQAACVLRTCPDRIEYWCSLLLPEDRDPNPLCKNIALAFAVHLSDEDPDTALRLIDGYTHVDDIVSRALGFTRLTMLQRAIWSPTTSERFNLRRRQRLELAPNDAALAQEVLAAERWGHTQFLEDLIQQWLSTPEPAHRARAITILGFRSALGTWPADLESSTGSVGFLAQVHTAAESMHLKNRDARYWYEKMCHASTSIDFWRFKTLMSKAVDHRADLWWKPPDDATAWISMYLSEVDDAVRNATSRQRSRLERRLYGLSKPPEAYFARRSGASSGKRMPEITDL